MGKNMWGRGYQRKKNVGMVSKKLKYVEGVDGFYHSTPPLSPSHME